MRKKIEENFRWCREAGKRGEKERERKGETEISALRDRKGRIIGRVEGKVSKGNK